MMENFTEVKKRKYNKRDLVTINTTAGIDEDVEIFIYKVFEQFEKNVGPRFSEFTSEWHKSNFGLIFCGRENFRETFEFTEELFHRVKKYVRVEMKGKAQHALVRYAGLYLMYSLYFKQPCRPRVKFRILKDEFEELVSLSQLARLIDKTLEGMFSYVLINSEETTTGTLLMPGQSCLQAMPFTLCLLVLLWALKWHIRFAQKKCLDLFWFFKFFSIGRAQRKRRKGRHVIQSGVF